MNIFMIRNEIKKIIKEILSEERLSSSVKIEEPTNEKFGDYSSNVLFLFPDKKEELFQKIKKRAEAKKDIEKAEAAGGGFVNFFLSPEYFQKETEKVLKKGEDFGKINLGKGEKVNIEFISANPTGPLTVANARGGPLGDVLGNAMETAGFEVEKMYFVNDFGNQIEILGHSVLGDELAQYWGDYIEKLKTQTQKKDAMETGEKAAEIIMGMIKKTIEKMGIKYDSYLLESALHKNGMVDNVISFLESKDLLYKKEGAVWFRSKKFGDNRDRVLVKSDGKKTYLAGDIALHKWKFEKGENKKAINIWGADHHGDVPGLQAGVSAIGHKGKLEIILCQFITLLEKGEKKRMSKRKGIFVTMDELLEEVGVDATRFFFLQRAANSHLNFDLDLAKENSMKNPVYYIQYALVRIKSIFRKISRKEGGNLEKLNKKEEISLMKKIIKLPEIIEKVVLERDPSKIADYAAELAKAFHKFYDNCSIIGEKSEETQSARLALLRGAEIALGNTLKVMGISAPDKM